MRLLVSLLLAAAVSAAELEPSTVAAWERYVAAAQVQAEHRGRPGGVFLRLHESQDLLSRVQSGEVVVAPVGEHPLKVPAGLIHHWMGAVFIAGASLRDVMQVVRDYNRYKYYFSPSVIDSKAIQLSSTMDRSSMILRSQTFFVKSALNAEYETHYVTLDERRFFSITRSTRIQEVDGYGQPNARALPEGEGTGVIWRVFNVNRCVERDGGVYLEMETIVLSRDIPGAVRWAVEPIVRRLWRSSLAASLKQTEAAITGRVEARGPHVQQASGH